MLSLSNITGETLQVPGPSHTLLQPLSAQWTRPFSATSTASAGLTFPVWLSLTVLCCLSGMLSGVLHRSSPELPHFFWRDGGLNSSVNVGSTHDPERAPLLALRCFRLESLASFGSRQWSLPYHSICWPILDWTPSDVPPPPPFTACRVGEASNPGPSAPSSWPFTPLSEDRELNTQTEPAQASSTSDPLPLMVWLPSLALK